MIRTPSSPGAIPWNRPPEAGAKSSRREGCGSTVRSSRTDSNGRQQSALRTVVAGELLASEMERLANAAEEAFFGRAERFYHFVIEWRPEVYESGMSSRQPACIELEADMEVAVTPV